MNSRPSTVLFDLDGTLIDTAPDFIRCLNLLRQQRGLPALPAEQIRRSVSNGARAMIDVGFGLGPDDQDYLEHHSAFLDLYEDGVAEETTLFPGMEELLVWLEGEGIPTRHHSRRIPMMRRSEKRWHDLWLATAKYVQRP